MRILVQRVRNASVTVDGAVTGAIERGLLVLVGCEESDAAEDIDWLSTKLVQLRIFDDDSGRMNFSVQDAGGDILLVSQFTLYASTRKGTRPSWHRAAKPELAVPLYEAFKRSLESKLGRLVPAGVFGAHMEVRLLNDGPVTFRLTT